MRQAGLGKFDWIEADLFGDSSSSGKKKAKSEN